ncbi:hypothetical protein ACRAWG_12435 [Methylobacterium sp. P31]
MNRPIPALLLAATSIALLPTATGAQDRTGSAPRAETAAKPAADTQDPGRTATEAVTNSATVPPTEGAVGSGKPPAGGQSPKPDR